MWVPDGAVLASALVGDTLYIGGWFTRLSEPLGPCVPFTRNTGTPAADFPEVPGHVRAMAPDGHGGWFIGGSFPRVGSVSRTNLAHVRPDFTVSDWAPSVARSGGMASISAIAVMGDVVYFGGEFDRVNGVPRTRLAAIDRVTGELLPWLVSADGEVHTLLVVDSLVYVGGAFDTLNGGRHVGIGAVHAETGAVEAWKPEAYGVRSMIADGDRLFIAGDFDRINTSFRPGLGAVSRTTGALMQWWLVNDAHFKSIVMVGDYIYADASRAFHRVTAQSKLWDAQPGGGEVYTMVAFENSLYVGGSFTTIGGKPRNGLAEIGLDDAQATAWNPNPSIAVRSLCVDGSVVYAGGDFSWANGIERKALAALDLKTGLPTSWNPSVSGGCVRALVATPDAIYAGGEFNAVGGEPRESLAAIDPASGEVLPWNFPVYKQAYPNEWFQRPGIQAMLMNGTTLYIAGQFVQVAGVNRQHLAAIDVAAGTLLPWAPDVWGFWPAEAAHVRALAIVDTTIYVGGNFDHIGTEERRNLAALSAVTGMPTAWNPRVDGDAKALLARGGRLFAGGELGYVNGQARGALAQFDLATGELTAWNPGAPHIVHALAADGVWLYVGGEFTSVAAVDQVTGSVADWHFAFDERDVIPPDVHPRIRVESITLGPLDAYIGVSHQGYGRGLPFNWLVATPSALEGLPTPVITVQGRAEILAAGLRLVWTDMLARAEAIVYRRTESTSWRALIRMAADHAGRLVFEDVEVCGPARYAYRLGIPGSDGESFAGETWIDVPGAPASALTMANPHSRGTALSISFSVADDGPVAIEVFDALGRQILRQETGIMQRGAHQIALDGSSRLRQGLYFVRLARGEGMSVKRLIVTD